MNYEDAYKSQIEKYKRLQEQYKAVCEDRDKCFQQVRQLQKECDLNNKEVLRFIDELGLLTKELAMYKREYERINREYSSLLNRMISAMDDILE